MPVAAFCGTFDPVSKGHMDLIERSSRLFDQLVVFVTPNSQKNEMFSLQQRVHWLEESCAHLSNVSVQVQDGLAVDACKKVGATVLVRGIRNGIDFDYEQNMAYMNHLIDENIETICLFTSEDNRYCSSSNIRELMKYHLDYKAMVPDVVYRELEEEKQ